jgi:hypothetical protein
LFFWLKNVSIPTESDRFLFYEEKYWIMKKTLQDYLEDKLLKFCTTCVRDIENETRSPLGRARKEAKTITKYMKKRWKIKE